ncbi:hypothetical protein OBBRIDRAFT_124006 [Obba rivulosa]|uniref:Uncharacterized protein n=1 Tax=Obba rivulosa TaxID=1052685 RepID=A0A8E2DRS9_9APHY|nr:hypothetical protein OBBRIDRAFT_124006 [Obba rivulosa]
MRANIDTGATPRCDLYFLGVRVVKRSHSRLVLHSAPTCACGALVGADSSDRGPLLPLDQSRPAPSPDSQRIRRLPGFIRKNHSTSANGSSRSSSASIRLRGRPFRIHTGRCHSICWTDSTACPQRQSTGPSK